jgi:hypothetical protein
MKSIKLFACCALVLALISTAALQAAETKKDTKVKPYTLKVCVVTNEKLDAMGKPYVFTEGEREIKLCCKGCLAEFNKNKDKYLKKIDELEKKEKAKQASEKPKS